MTGPTSPAIRDAQNKDSALRLLQAQRRLYADAKTLQHTRLGVVLVGAVIGVAVGLSWPAVRTALSVASTVSLLILSLLGGSREKRRTREAAAVQDEFDTTVLRLPWNDLLAERPTPTLIADAVRRSQPTADLPDWYPDTETTVRPLDVLICQRSNLGWGVTLHRAWAAAVLGVAVAVLVLVGVAVTALSAPLIAFAPLLPALRELGEIIKNNWDSAASKHTGERNVVTLWRTALTNRDAVTDNDLRRVQDRILTFRQTNASVPDWFHIKRRNANEETMRGAANAQVAEAREHGLA